MSITPIFCQVSERLREFIAWQEVEDSSGSIRFGRRPPGVPSIKPKAHRGRWVAEIDFREPAPFFERPISASGATSFHLRWDGVSKSPASSRSVASSTTNPATDHEAYISDEAKLEPRSLPPTDANIEDGNVEDGNVDADGWIFVSPTVQLITNIHPSGAMRWRFWNGVYAAERTPHPDRIAIHVDGTADDAWWRAVADHDGAPTRLRKIAAKVLKRRALGERRSSAKVIYVDCGGPASASATFEALKSLPGWDSEHPCLRLVTPRAGRVQYQMVAEVPFELSVAQRSALLEAFADKFNQLGFMFTLVIHAPDRSNHERNYHIHAVVYDRLCRFYRELHKWDFELTSKERSGLGLGPRNSKTAHDRKPGSGAYWEAGKTFLKDLRAWYADACNQALERLAIERRLDPRRYEEMGIPQEPTVHLGKRVFPLVAAGVPTAIGADNAEKIWRGAEALNELQFNRLYSARSAAVDVLRHRLKGRGDDTVGEQIAYPLGILVEVIVEDIELLGKDEQAVDRLRIKRAMAESAARRVLMECDAVLGGIADGTASGADRRAQGRIEARRAAAADHLNAIASALRPLEQEATKRNHEIALAAERLQSNQRKAFALLRMLDERTLEETARLQIRDEAPPTGRRDSVSRSSLGADGRSRTPSLTLPAGAQADEGRLADRGSTALETPQPIDTRLEEFLAELRRMAWIPYVEIRAKLRLQVHKLPVELRSSARLFQDTPQVEEQLQKERERRDAEHAKILQFIRSSAKRLDDPTDPIFPEVHPGRFPLELQRRVRLHVLHSEEVREALLACKRRAENASHLPSEHPPREAHQREKNTRKAQVASLILDDLSEADKPAYQAIKQALEADPMRIALATSKEGVQVATCDLGLRKALWQAANSPDLWPWLRSAAENIAFKHEKVPGDWRIFDVDRWSVSLPMHRPGYWKLMHGPVKRKGRRRRTGDWSATYRHTQRNKDRGR